ncbi:PREDICTED: uncharacterized protein LOC107167177 [Diuraphis noxia]|uniref:uncharacterized protein LOC107167177 n=1 Tax=Diuraphis noxia TaxID=143948 RepID=UPI000763B966|nr:PREDICTED: uncharacterized protein LOC107167177 [Diuraphis noxia]
MEDHIGGSSSSSDDDSAPPVIMPPPPSRYIINEDEIIDLDGIAEHHQRRRRNNRHRRQMRHTGHAALIEAEHGVGGIIDLVNREAMAISIDHAAEEDAAAASGNCDLNKVRSYKDMLKYTTNLSDGMPMTINQDRDAFTFTEERKKFLSNVLSTMTVNVHEEMNNSINILFDSNKQVDEHEFAFDVIAEYVDNIDYANDFEKLGGFHIFLPCIRSEHPSVRIKTAELISTLVQHNPYCQEKFMENPNYLKALISMVENDLNDEVRVKALAAISSLVRHNITVFWQFIELGGKDLIINSLKTPIDKLKIKAVFIICSTCHMGNDIAEMYIDNGVVEIISSIIMGMEKNFEPFHHELFLSTLNQLLRMSPARVKEICSSMEDLKPALTSLQDSYSDESRYQDEKDQILWLMETLTL